jgi:hypothetical protein
LKKGGFLVHRSLSRSEDETEIRAGEGIGRKGREGHPPRDAARKAARPQAVPSSMRHGVVLLNSQHVRFLKTGKFGKIYAQSLNAPLYENRFPPGPAEDKKECFETRRDRGPRA